MSCSNKSMILNLSGPIDAEMLELLINTCNAMQKEDEITIYFCSNGGDVDIAVAMIHVINNCSNGKILFVGRNMLYSAALLVYTLIDVQKEVLAATRGMIHQSTLSVDINESGTTRDSEQKHLIKMLKKEISTLSKSMIERIKLSKKELKRYNKGHDVYLSFDTLSNI